MRDLFDTGRSGTKNRGTERGRFLLESSFSEKGKFRVFKRVGILTGTGGMNAMNGDRVVTDIKGDFNIGVVVIGGFEGGRRRREVEFSILPRLGSGRRNWTAESSPVTPSDATDALGVGIVAGIRFVGSHN